jgi:pimeloyl-ACP methyl ester carboxylesterase
LMKIIKTLVVTVVALVTLVLLAGYLYSANEWNAIEATYPPQGQFVDVTGTRLHYTDKGKGPVIVLLHGASTTLADYEASITPKLVRNYRVIAFDRPGYGYSERPQGDWMNPARQAALVHGALRTLGVDKATIVGHSLGGAVALAYVLEYSETASGLVLLGGAAYPWKTGTAWTNHVAAMPYIGALFAATAVLPAANIKLKPGIAHVFSPNPIPDDYIHRTRIRLALRPQAFRSSAEDVLRLSPYLEGQSRRYGELTLPMLLITGTDDDVVPAWNHTDRLEKLLPHARIIRLTGTGHAPHHVHTHQVAQQIADFAAITSN